MERPNITEERFDEICNQAGKLNAIFKMLNEYFDDNERFIMISMIFSKFSHEMCGNDDDENEKNLKYVNECIEKRQKSIFKKSK
jgi:oligoendopeptidase F